MSDPLAQAGVKRSKEMTAVLQHVGTRCDPGTRGFESAIVLMNKRENYGGLNKPLNWKSEGYLWESLTFSIFKPTLQMEDLVASNSKSYSAFKGSRGRLGRNI